MIYLESDSRTKQGTRESQTTPFVQHPTHIRNETTQAKLRRIIPRSPRPELDRHQLIIYETPLRTRDILRHHHTETITKTLEQKYPRLRTLGPAIWPRSMLHTNDQQALLCTPLDRTEDGTRKENSCRLFVVFRYLGFYEFILC